MTAIKRCIFYMLRILATYHATRKCASYGPGLTVNHPCFFTNKTRIGTDCHFNGMTVVGTGALDIGDHFHSGSDILVLTSNHNHQSAELLPYDEKDIERPVTIGDCVWAGSRAIILPGARIGHGVIIQAGAVVHGEVPDCAIVGGNPARILRFRDEAVFRRLVRDGRYLGWPKVKKAK